MTLASGSIQQNTLKNAIGIVQLRKNTEALSAGRKNITASGRRSPSSRVLTKGLISLTPKEFKQSQAQPIGELRELLHFCHLSTPRISKLKKKKSTCTPTTRAITYTHIVTFKLVLQTNDFVRSEHGTAQKKNRTKEK